MAVKKNKKSNKRKKKTPNSDKNLQKAALKGAKKAKSGSMKDVKKVAKQKITEELKKQRSLLQKVFKKLPWLKPFLNLIISILVGIGILGSLIIAMDWYFQDRAFIGVSLLGEDVSFQDREDIADDLRQKVSVFFDTPFILNVMMGSGSSYEMSPVDLGIEVSVSDTLRKVMAVGNRGLWWQRLRDKFWAFVYGEEIPLSVRVDEDRLWARLEGIPELKPPRFSDLVEFDRYGRMSIRSDIPFFYDFDKTDILAQILRSAEIITPRTMDLEVVGYVPEVTEEKVSILNDTMAAWKDRKISLVYHMDHRRDVFELDFAGDPAWFVVREEEEDSGEKTLHLDLNNAKINEFLSSVVVPEVNYPRTDAHLYLNEENELIVDGHAHDGEALDFDAAKQLVMAMLQGGTGSVFLPIQVEPPVVEVDKEVTEKYGITDLLATGWSDFSYSPSNRINNVKVGLGKFDGILVPPEETFSFNQNLGYVGSATGFLPELVIKPEGTVPEFGGGLCQVSTTHYRAALRAGLPIVDRRPHAYHVFHYEPGGSDATIYPPSPDIKFLNDTDAHILVQTWTDGEDAYVNLYGNPDGREVTLEGPWISRWRSPGPAIVIPTTDLPTGQRVTVEYQVYGFDALWKRKIEWPDGRVDEEDIDSRYRPWPAVLKVGI